MYKSVTAACLLAAYGSLAHAGMPLASSFYQGSDATPAGTLSTTSQSPGDLVRNLSYNFTGTNQYAGAFMALNGIYTGTHVRLRLRAPATANLILRIRPWPGLGADRVIALNRGNATVDASGWETQTVQISSSALGVSYIEVAAQSPSSMPSQDAAATVSFRGVELWAGAPPAGSEPNYSKTVVPSAVTADPQSAAGTLLSSDNYYTGDDFQRVDYNFGGTNQYAGVLMTPAAATPASYARFKVWAPAGANLVLKVTPSAGGLPVAPISVDKSYGVADGTGWVSYVVPLGADPVSVASLALYTQKVSGAPVSGRLYFKDVELRDHAPTAHEPLAPLSPISVSLGAPETGVGATASEFTWNSAGDTSFRYNFTSGWSEAFVASNLTLSQAVKANRLRFLAKVPSGAPMVVRFHDDQGNIFNAKLFKPFATAYESGWVPYSVKLEPVGNSTATSVGNITKISLRIERSMTNSNAVTVSKQESTVSPIGTAQFKQLVLLNEPDQLDLAPSTPTLAGGARAKGSNAWPILGVATRDPVGDLSHAQELGLSWMRFDMTWQTVEPVGQSLDLTVKKAPIDAVLAQGMKVVLLLAYNNKKYSEWQSDDHGGMAVTATGNLTAYINYVTALVNAYKGNPNVTFELWNEPNNSTFWQPSRPYPTMAAEYANVLSKTVEAIRNADTNAIVVSGGLARIDFLYLNMLSKTAALANVTGVGLHPYTDGYPEATADEMAAASAMMRANAPPGTTSFGNLRPWFTELGQSSGRLRVPASQTNGADPLNRRIQGNLIARQILASWSTGTPMHIIYRMRDLYPWETGYNLEQANYGLFSVNQTSGVWTDKPASNAVRTLKYVAKDRQYQGMVTGSPSNVQAMKFSALGKETVYAVWANSTGTQANVSTLPSCNLYLNLDGSARSTAGACVVDLENNPVTCSPGSNGRQICPVSESGGPIYVRVSGS